MIIKKQVIFCAETNLEYENNNNVRKMYVSPFLEERCKLDKNSCYPGKEPNISF